MLTPVVTEDTNGDGIGFTGASDTLPATLRTDWPSIEKLRKRFDEARSTLQQARLNSQRDRDYYDGPLQLNSDVRRTLGLRGQPAIYTNRIRPAVNGVLGVLEGARTDPRAYARNPDDDQENVADVATKALRFIADQSRFGDIKQDVADNFLVEGTGACIVELVEGKIVPTQIRWEEFYHDPFSRRADLADATYNGIAKWYDAEQIKQKWRTRIDEIGDPMRPMDAAGIDVQYQDRPLAQGWIDIRRRRVMLVEEYALEGGTWMRTVYIAAGVLEHGPSPYMEYVEGGGQRPCNPIVAQSCYVNKDNERYGMVRDMIPIQDEVNASRSRSLHLMNSRQIQCVDPTAPPVDTETVRQEAAKADGVLPMGWNKIDSSEMTQANMLRMAEAKSEIERMGPTPAILGRNISESASGRSKQVSQQAGMTELARPLGRLSGWEHRVYVQAWWRAKQFWTDEKWIRITSDVRAPEFLKINEPVMGMVMQPVMGADGQPVINPATGQPAVQPAIGQVSTKNRLAEMDVDIILDTVPDTATLEQEVWSELRDLATTGLDIFSPQFELMIEMSPLSDKARILEKLKKAREEGQQQQQEQAAKIAQAEEEARQLAIADAQSKVRKTDSETHLNEVKATEIAATTMHDLHERVMGPPSGEAEPSGNS